MIAPDATTLDWLKGRPYAPAGTAWQEAVEKWSALRSDDAAKFDREIGLDARDIAPMVTWGTSPEDALPITGRVPDPAQAKDAARREAMERALGYMGLAPGTKLDA